MIQNKNKGRKKKKCKHEAHPNVQDDIIVIPRDETEKSRFKGSKVGRTSDAQKKAGREDLKRTKERKNEIQIK
jgi:hypothetical protein